MTEAQGNVIIALLAILVLQSGLCWDRWTREIKKRDRENP